MGGCAGGVRDVNLDVGVDEGDECGSANCEEGLYFYGIARRVRAECGRGVPLGE